MISKKEVQHVSKLARIEISAEQESKFTSELSSIVGYVDQIQKVDTEDETPTFHPSRSPDQDALVNITREDKVKSFKNREALLEAAPMREGSFFKVK
ncbi:Asp-tRNA(Asn)/Glu-tRNA(Gln) amidotransferase subunit GatC, partial [Patescibacteria group bacterium]|nr:Asp-tRNA(Asn)/Glu-tRNA(Gln) amidotransferase subunit GatC [Patescibacteria group bacterium]